MKDMDKFRETLKELIESATSAALADEFGEHGDEEYWEKQVQLQADALIKLYDAASQR